MKTKLIFLVCFLLQSILYAQEPVKIDYKGQTLFVYPEDVKKSTDEGIQWYTVFTSSMEMANAKNESNGVPNTSAIINAYAEKGEAANMCKDLNAFGYNDWYLPSIEELMAIYNNKDKLGIKSGHYWSSTEINEWTAWMIDFSTGEKAAYNKISRMSIRPVRKN